MKPVWTRLTACAAAAVVLLGAWWMQAEGADRHSSATDGEAVTARLRGLEARVTLLEQRLENVVTALHNDRKHQPETSPSEQPAPAAVEGLPLDVPTTVRGRLLELHPGGRVIEHGRSEDDGYYWFEVRIDGRLMDVEITDEGEVRKNRRTFFD